MAVAFNTEILSGEMRKWSMVGDVQTSVVRITSVSETSEWVSPDLKPDRRMASVMETNPIPAPNNDRQFFFWGGRVIHSLTKFQNSTTVIREQNRAKRHQSLML